MTDRKFQNELKPLYKVGRMAGDPFAVNYRILRKNGYKTVRAGAGSDIYPEDGFTDVARAKHVIVIYPKEGSSQPYVVFAAHWAYSMEHGGGRHSPYFACEYTQTELAEYLGEYKVTLGDHIPIKKAIEKCK